MDAAEGIAQEAANKILEAGGPWAAAFLLAFALFVGLGYIVWRDRQSTIKDLRAANDVKDAKIIELLTTAKADAERYAEESVKLANATQQHNEKLAERVSDILDVVRGRK